MKVLVVDDDEVDVMIIKRAIANLVTETIHVSTAAKAMGQLKHNWDLIICDVNIPGACGREVIDAIRQLANCPVLVCTGMALEPGDYNKNDLGLLVTRVAQIQDETKEPDRNKWPQNTSAKTA